jgi:type IV secretion system protein VirD4
VGRLPRDEAIVLIAGANPVRDKKFRIETHPRYRLVDPGHPGADFAERFDFGDYWNARSGGGDAR